MEDKLGKKECSKQKKHISMFCGRKKHRGENGTKRGFKRGLVDPAKHSDFILKVMKSYGWVCKQRQDTIRSEILKDPPGCSEKSVEGAQWKLLQRHNGELD